VAFVLYARVEKQTIKEIARIANGAQHAALLQTKSVAKKEGRAKARPYLDRYGRRPEGLLVGAGIAASTFPA
jgi:hypothetical protein